MKTSLDCIPCFFRQALESARIAGLNPQKQKEVLDNLAKVLPKFPLDSSPPEIGKYVYGLVNKIACKKDPYKQIKEKNNRLALSVYDKLKNKTRKSTDSLLTAVELSIAGNIIDYGVKNSLNVEEELKAILEEEKKVIKNEKGNKTGVAKKLGIGRTTLWRKMQNND